MSVSNHGLHHLHIRKRIYKNLEKYPHQSFFKRWLDYAMYGVAVLTPAALVPQVLQIFTQHDASGLSMPTWVLLGLLNLLWVLYAVAHREAPIFITNVLLAGLNFTVVYGIILFH